MPKSAEWGGGAARKEENAKKNVHLRISILETLKNTNRDRRQRAWTGSKHGRKSKAG